MIAFKTNTSKDMSCLLETYLKMHATQNQTLCSGKTLGHAVTVSSDIKENTYTPLVLTSAIPLNRDPFHSERLIVTDLVDQDETIYADIPSSENPLHKELVVTQSDQEASKYTELAQEEGVYMYTAMLDQEDYIYTELDQDEAIYAQLRTSVRKNVALFEITESNQNETTYTERCSSIIPGREDHLYKELVVNPSDQEESIYNERCSSAISSSEDPLSNELIVTPSHQGKICTKFCTALIPSKQEPAIKELIVTPSDQDETMYSPPCSSVVPLVEDHTSHSDQTISTTQSGCSGNGDIVTCIDSAIALVNRRYNTQTKSINDTSQEGCIFSSDQTTPITQPKSSDHDACNLICHNYSSESHQVEGHINK